MPNEYISREAAQYKIREQNIHPETDYGQALSDAVAILQGIPAADVVPVVRCKDCEQYVAGELGYGKCNFFKTAIFSEFYCRYGGKKGRAE